MAYFLFKFYQKYDTINIENEVIMKSKYNMSVQDNIFFAKRKIIDKSGSCFMS